MYFVQYHLFSRISKNKVNMGLFKESVKVKFRTEKYIAFKNNTMSKFQA